MTDAAANEPPAKRAREDAPDGVADAGGHLPDAPPPVESAAAADAERPIDGSAAADDADAANDDDAGVDVDAAAGTDAR